MTNADRLNAMTVEEKAVFFANFTGGKKMQRAVPELAKQIVDVITGKEADND